MKVLYCLRNINIFNYHESIIENLSDNGHIVKIIFSNNNYFNENSMDPNPEERINNLNNVSFEYQKGNPVIKNIELKINSGNIVALVGPSGCGKSTLLRLLAGLILPSKGFLKIFGEDQSYLRLDQEEPADVRLVFQNPALLGSLTVEENVGFLLKLITIKAHIFYRIFKTDILLFKIKIQGVGNPYLSRNIKI